MSWISEQQDALKSQARTISEKITDIKPKLKMALGPAFTADLDVEVDAILDDSFLRAIDRAATALENTRKHASAECQNLVKQLFDNLSKLEKQLEDLIDKIFKDVDKLIENIKERLFDPLKEMILELEKRIFEDIREVLDIIFDFWEGTEEKLKIYLETCYGPYLIPNLLDPCRWKLDLVLTPGWKLTYSDWFNLVECGLLKRLEDDDTTVKEIKENYANLQIESFKMTCLDRSNSGVYKIYSEKWLDYGILFEIWDEFEDTMTAQKAYDEAIKKLQQAREEYQAKVADIEKAQKTANAAQTTANAAQTTANAAQTTANAAQKTARDIQKDATPYVNSGVLKHIKDEVGFAVRPGDGYHFFTFPNILAWDTFANGAFYSATDFVKTGHTLDLS